MRPRCAARMAADALQEIPSYAPAPAVAGGLRRAPDPLPPVVVRAIDPRRALAPPASAPAAPLPGDVLRVARHTHVMVEVAPLTAAPWSWWRGLRHQPDMHVAGSAEAAAAPAQTPDAARHAREALWDAWQAPAPLEHAADAPVLQCGAARRTDAGQSAPPPDPVALLLCGADDVGAAKDGGAQPMPPTPRGPAARDAADPSQRSIQRLAHAIRRNPHDGMRATPALLALRKAHADDMQRAPDAARDLPPAEPAERLAREIIAAWHDARAMGMIPLAGADLDAFLAQVTGGGRHAPACIVHADENGDRAPACILHAGAPCGKV